MTWIEGLRIRQALRDFCRAYHIEINVVQDSYDDPAFIEICNADTQEFITDFKGGIK